MSDLLFWLYLTNAVLLINHEIDSAVIHTYFLKQGRKEFDKPLSKLILVLTLLVSIAQMIVTIHELNA
jgi:hypothetical protein